MAVQSKVQRPDPSSCLSGPWPRRPQLQEEGQGPCEAQKPQRRQDFWDPSQEQPWGGGPGKAAPLRNRDTGHIQQ